MEMKKYKLENLCTKITDGSHYSPVAVESGYPMFSVKDMEEFGFSYTDVKLISEDDFQKMCENDCVPQKNDVLVAKDGSYLKEAFVCMETKKEAILSSIAIFRPNIKLVNPYYLAYLFKTPNVYNYVTNGCVSGTALPRIVLKAFKQIEVFIPSLKQQNNVVSVLSSLDDKIALNKKINAKLEAMAKRLYDYWFVQFDFPNGEGKPYKTSGGKMVWNEVLKRKIPEGWEVKCVNDISVSYRGVGYSASDEKSANDKDVMLILRGNNISNNHIVYDKNTVYLDKSFVSEEQKINKFDILMTMSSGSKEHVGKSSMFLFDSPHSYGAFCNKITPNKECQFFLENYLHSEFFKKYIKVTCSGTGINNLTNQHFDKARFAFPTKIILNLFNEKVKTCYEQIGFLEQEIQKLTKLRDRLLPLLMNGQVEVE